MENNNENMWHMLQKKRIASAILMTIIFLAAFLLVKTFSEIKAYSFIGGGVPSSNTITVSGEGEAFAVPDIATFSFSVIEEDTTVAKAQDSATKKMNIALALVRDAGVDEKDIKTTGYNISPEYDYIRGICTEYSCPPGKQQLRGYRVSQTISVKVRDTGKAGEVLAQIGSVGVSNISGLNFTVDDEDEPIREARKEAIKDAEEKAKELASDLGVKLVRVVSFSEGGRVYSQRAYETGVSFAMDEGIGGGIPEIPVGENTITSNVTITYEIR